MYEKTAKVKLFDTYLVPISGGYLSLSASTDIIYMFTSYFVNVICLPDFACVS